MEINFESPKNGQTIELDTVSMEKFLRQEHKERRGDIENPGGYSPSLAFNRQSQTLQSTRSEHTQYLLEKLNNGETVLKTDIEASKLLERLSIMASFDPDKDHFKHAERNLLNKGKSNSRQMAVYEGIEINASRKGIMEGSNVRPTVSIQVSHRPL